MGTRLLVLLVSMGVQLTALADCFDDVAKKRNFDVDLLRAIAWQESSFRQEALNTNKNGTVDVGTMMINQIHFSRLRDMGVSEEALRNDKCMNIQVGAFILAELVSKYGLSWNTVGMYNAGVSTTNPVAIRNRAIYSKKIQDKYTKIKLYRQWLAQRQGRRTDIASAR